MGFSPSVTLTFFFSLAALHSKKVSPAGDLFFYFFISFFCEPRKRELERVFEFNQYD